MRRGWRDAGVVRYARVVGGAIGALVLSQSLAAQQVTVRDGAGTPVTLKAPARRVAALMSSAVDIMIAMGAADRLVARTRYDTSNTVARAANVGGGIDPSVEVLLSSRPDLLIAWKGSASRRRWRARGLRRDA